MFTEKMNLHGSNPKPMSEGFTKTMKAPIDSHMTMKKRFRAAMIWISEKLPCSHPQFQIIYGADKENSSDEA
jgi:hypothetical protein